MMRTILVGLLLGLSARAQEAAPLTVERIFASSEFAAETGWAAWLPDGAYLGWERRDLVRRVPGEAGSSVFVRGADLVPPGREAPLGVDGLQSSAALDRVLIYTESRRVWRHATRGDYWVLDRATRRLVQLGRAFPPSSLMFAELSPDGSRAAYVHDRDLYLEDPATGEVRRLTTRPDDRVINGTFDWVYEEELDLRKGFHWSPDGTRLAYWQVDTRGVPDVPLVNNTDTLYPRVTWIPYPKVGQTNSAVRMGVLDLASGETAWIELPGDPREHYLARASWTPAGDALLLQRLNRRQDRNTLWLADARTGRAKELYEERDDAWVDVHDELFWLPDGKSFTWISERDGWRHVWRGSLDGAPMAQVTKGAFDVVQLLGLGEDGFYFTASPESAAERFLYRVGRDGDGLRRLTPEGARGVHRYVLSPDGRAAIHTASRFDDPPRSAIVRLPDHESVRILGESARARAALKGLAMPPAEFFRVPIGEGVELDAWCLLPPGFRPDGRYPLLVYVYGEPAGATVVDSWPGSTGLWHRMLAQRGYVVMSFDNRGTKAPRGRAWRKSVHRKIGILPPAEQAAAVRQVLATRPYLDPSRVGIWGWSGGGSSSLQALFRHPDLYRAGIAIASVPNQRYYDSIYQERYMGLPSDNPEGYIEGSPITHAAGLKGSLLLIHGTGDDNCHYQTAELLIDELVRLGKPFRMFAYPNRSHSISERPGTRTHLYDMMTRFLLETLPPSEPGAAR